MDREQFEELVVQVAESLPEEFQRHMENVALVVEDWPSRDQLTSVGLTHRAQLLGLYQGVPLTHGGWRHAALPDKITIFQKPIELMCRSEADIRKQVGETLRHEIGHHFGMSEQRLEEIEDERED